jgi:DNA polymerase III alpha subunit
MKVRTGYSFNNAVGHLPDVISRLKEIKWLCAPISDFGSTYGFLRYSKLAKKAGLRPIYGVELNVACRIENDKRLSMDRWCFFAKDEIKPLNELIALATTNCGHDPKLSYEQAVSAKGLIKVAGPQVQLNEITGRVEDLFIGLSPAISKGLFAEAKAKKYKFIAVSENSYPRSDDKEFYRIALGKRSNVQTYPQHIMSDQEWIKSVQQIANKDDVRLAIANRELAMKKCVAVLKPAKLIVPKHKKSLLRMCEDGARDLNVDLKAKAYTERLRHELNVIQKMGNEDYFYLLADLIAYARSHMIVGPGRGSSCGSLVCYLLGITSVDPLKYGLLFERFLDPTRTDTLPDIDIDLPDTDRQKVIDYLRTKYGQERVAKLGTVRTFAAQSALNAICGSLQIPRWKADAAILHLIVRNDGDAGAFETLKDTLRVTEPGQRFMSEYPEVGPFLHLEGHPTHAGVHAAGVILTNEEIDKTFAVDQRSGATMCDMKDAEELGCLKVDCLGLAQLSVFQRTLELINERE